jgi:hypothetical protein
MSYGAGCNGYCHGEGMLEAVPQQAVGAMQAIHPAARHVVRRRLQWECWKQFPNKRWAPREHAILQARHVVRRRLQWVLPRCGSAGSSFPTSCGRHASNPSSSSPCRTAQAAMGATTVWECWKQFPNKRWAPREHAILQARHAVMSAI